MIKRALLSVSDKTGLLDFARALAAPAWKCSVHRRHRQGCWRDAGLPVTEVSDYTGFPEMLDGRVKTLHPRSTAASSAGATCPSTSAMQARHRPIDLVVVNLYPFAADRGQARLHLEDAIENIDIGGPAMVRAAAKNHADVTVVVDPRRLRQVLTRCWPTAAPSPTPPASTWRSRPSSTPPPTTAPSPTTFARRWRLAEFPRTVQPAASQGAGHALRREPAPGAAFYVEAGAPPASVATAKQLQGKELSYNNIADADAAWECVKQFDEPACVIVKHANPCGVAWAPTCWRPTTAPARPTRIGLRRHHRLQPRTRRRDRQGHRRAPVRRGHHRAEASAPRPVPSWPPRRTCACSPAASLAGTPAAPGLQARQRRPAGAGRRPGSLCGPTSRWSPSARPPTRRCATCSSPGAWPSSSSPTPSSMPRRHDHRRRRRPDEPRQLRPHRRIKAGTGRPGGPGRGHGLDAFFPFRDGIDAAAAGITAVIQPGGSMRDDEVIAAADEHGMAMVFTGMRHFRH
jgi:phosphoribosylaminoimidazolecarboxamide formyltransferase/IMP cyclohydrolase